MKIDLLLAKSQRSAALAERDDLHAQHPRIEIAGPGDVGDGKHEVIEAFDLHHSVRMRFTTGKIATSAGILSVPRAGKGKGVTDHRIEMTKQGH
jgi:hypothetical protein